MDPQLCSNKGANLLRICGFFAHQRTTLDRRTDGLGHGLGEFGVRHLNFGLPGFQPVAIRALRDLPAWCALSVSRSRGIVASTSGCPPQLMCDLVKAPTKDGSNRT
jgi:hypothetical protein